MLNQTHQIRRDRLDDKQLRVFDQVAALYNHTNRPIAQWLWKNHVQTVAYFALQLANTYGADPDMCFSAALLHDVADVWCERTEPTFEAKTKQTTQEVLAEAGFNPEVCSCLFDKVIESHSCYPGHLPETLEGKVLATADAMAHLLTNFYHDFQAMGLPTSDPVKFTDWVLKKLERDFHRKIFFSAVIAQVRPQYERLKSEFET